MLKQKGKHTYDSSLPHPADIEEQERQKRINNGEIGERINIYDYDPGTAHEQPPEPGTERGVVEIPIMGKNKK